MEKELFFNQLFLHHALKEKVATILWRPFLLSTTPNQLANLRRCLIRAPW